METQIFISHVTEQARLAARLKQRITEDFLGQVGVFMSSDTESIAAGELWFSSLSRALHDSAIFVVLCDRAALSRPWINFESGAAWMRDIPVIPLCSGGLRPRDLPMPLLAYQGLELADGSGLLRLYSRIAQAHGCQLPVRDFDTLAAELAAFADRPPGDGDPAVPGTGSAIRSRIDEALNHPRFRWRSLDRLAAAAAVPVETATEILQNDPRVRFSRGRSGDTIVGLRSRVG
jgi:hypothetical protein